MNLEKFVGETILAMVEMVPGKIQRLKLLGVEAGGIWVESQYLTNFLLTQLGAASAPKTPVFFVPYSRIFFVFHGEGRTALNEEAFGV